MMSAMQSVTSDRTGAIAYATTFLLFGCNFAYSDDKLCARYSCLNSEIQIARSKDGKEFVEANDLVIPHACFPSLAILPNGSLIALYDAGIENDVAGTQIVAITSTTNGRTWSKPQPIHIDTATASASACRPALLRIDNGVRLFFVAVAAEDRVHRGRDQKTKESAPQWEIRSAISRDGIHYKLEPIRVARLSNLENPFLVVGKSSSKLHLYVTAFKKGTGAATDCSTLRTDHYVSREGERMVRIAPLKLDDVVFDGSVETLKEGGGFRVFASGDKGVEILRSSDGSRWKLDEGTVIKNAHRPAAIHTPEGYVMLFCRTMPGVEQELTADSGNSEVAVRGDYPDDKNDVRGADVGAAPLVPEPGGATADDLLDGEEDFDPELAPAPTYDQTVDYAQWFLVQTQDAMTSPAADAYEAFLPNPPPQGDDAESDWPKFNGMYNSGTYNGPPAPWDPKEHPDWELSPAEQVVLDKYRSASALDGPAGRYTRRISADGSGADEDSLLFNILLPSLSSHRQLTKAILADAWRAENGKVSPERMLNAWKTVLRSSRQLDQGVTLIEDLVGIAQRNLVQRDALWALKNGVFNDAQIEDVFKTLRELDKANEDMGRLLRFEHAAQMDVIQFLFSPPTPDGKPQLNTARVDILKEFGAVGPDDWKRRAMQMTPADAETSTIAVDKYFGELAEAMRIGYPVVRASDLDVIEQRYVHATPVTEMGLPALSRYFHLHTRSISSRRATQLVYALHIYKSRKGHWPKTLNELPAELGETMHTDPFTGEDFGYRLTPDGPIVFSFGENGVDDGGVHSFNWGAMAKPGESDDNVFWPPQPPPK
ncbi:MAG: exo-alpha-sialidase [Planctomycetes bacterium]|nr:exo-alpha-sialidase [Planctomycetota bacterium]MBI3835914.1 exo-alpha-sialidase [Planctomycetota bacterium]